MTNVWGGGQRSESAYEENILKEIESCADLGIEVVQIDAGWSRDMNANEPWLPSEKVYPEGWGNIQKFADEKVVKLGVWNTAERVDKYDSLLTGLNDEGFLYYKIDIGTWNSYAYLQSITQKSRELLKHSDYKARVNWDVTHKGLRVGYFYNREYGNLFLQNRRLEFEGQSNPLSHLYVPRRILKDQWLFTPYLNLNQIMFNVQTTEFVNHEYSNANLYGDVYSFAIAMMCTPLYFTETWRFAPEDRAPVRELISIYKAHRDELYEGYVFRLGDRPDDTSWTGFQNVHPDENIGYLTLFREIDNKDMSKRIHLHFIKGKTLEIEDLMTGKKKNYKVDGEGYVEFSMEHPASFRFYKYQIKN